MFSIPAGLNGSGTCDVKPVEISRTQTAEVPFIPSVGGLTRGDRFRIWLELGIFNLNRKLVSVRATKVPSRQKGRTPHC